MDDGSGGKERRERKGDVDIGKRGGDNPRYTSSGGDSNEIIRGRRTSRWKS